MGATMNSRAMPGLAYLRECFTLTDDGALIWQQRPASHFANEVIASRWNGKHAGTVAGVEMDRGYRKIIVGNRRYYAHRLVYFIAHEVDPTGLEIDHVDGDPRNNRPSNLRLATHGENGRNTATPRNNTSGVKGVGWNRDEKKWKARVVFDGTEHSALFRSKDDAAAWVSTMRAKLHGEFARHQ